jgi:hypothetical protein
MNEGQKSNVKSRKKRRAKRAIRSTKFLNEQCNWQQRNWRVNARGLKISAGLGAAEDANAKGLKSDSGKTSGTGAASISIPINIDSIYRFNIDRCLQNRGPTPRRGLTMSAEIRDREPQFVNPTESKVEDETTTDASPRNQMNREAEKLAKKSSKVEQDSSRDRPIFSK